MSQYFWEMKPFGAARLVCRGLRCRALTTAQGVRWEGRERPARSALKSKPSKPFGQKYMSPFPADLAASKELARLMKEGAAERTAHCRTLYAPNPSGATNHPALQHSERQSVK